MARDQRRLAAIVSADVAGYSRLMGRDESGTLAALKAHRRELIDPKIAEYDGRIVKTTGDGLLLEFPSVVDAVRCSVEVQRGMAERNESVAADTRLAFRIGINVGDIIIDGDDIFGDGVNVAARLQELAEPGGICVSATVREQTHGKIDAGFVDNGDQRVKNIAQPIRVFSMDLKSTATSGSITPAGFPTARLWRKHGLYFLVSVATLALVAGVTVFILNRGVDSGVRGRADGSLPLRGTQPPAMSVAVLPFDTAGASVADDHLAETLRSDVAMGIARGMRSGKVVSDGLVAGYKNKAVDARSAGRDLNVRYLITGDIRSAGERTVVNVQLVETFGGTQVWTDRLELPQHRDLSDEATLVSSLALRLRGAITQAERRRAKSTAGSPDASAMDLVLQADVLLFNSEGQSYREARRLYDEAIRMDPGLTAALIGRAWTFDHEIWNDPRADAERLAQEFDRDSVRAVELDPKDALSWSMRETALAWLGRRDAAKQANAMARQLDPMSTMLLSDAAWETLLDGEPDKGIAFLEQARAIDPNVGLSIAWTTCFLEVYRANYSIAAPSCEKTVLLYPGWWLEYAFLTAALAQSNNAQKAAQSKAALLKLKPDFSIRGYSPILMRLSADPEYRHFTEERLLAGLRKAGVPE